MNLVGDFAKSTEVSGSEVLLSSSSELQKDKQQHTGLQFAWLVAVVHGVEGSNEKFHCWKHIEFWKFIWEEWAG